MRALILSCCLAITLVALAPAAGASEHTTTHAGLFFTIVNDCSAPVSGFAVGDKLCLLKVEMATYMRGIFQGTMGPGQTQFAMACAGDDGKAVVLFVPPVTSGAQAVEKRVAPNEKVAIPRSYCPAADEQPGSQLRHGGGMEEDMEGMGDEKMGDEEMGDEEMGGEEEMMDG